MRGAQCDGGDGTSEMGHGTNLLLGSRELGIPVFFLVFVGFSFGFRSVFP